MHDKLAHKRDEQGWMEHAVWRTSCRNL
jgi:hypothetical protein